MLKNPFQDIPFVIQHPENKLGRDFIVGDLHGCRSLLETLMQHVAFNPDKDRLFSVGDLIDRGPESLRTLELLNEPWFFPVLGNHEAMFMAYTEVFNHHIYSRSFRNNAGTNWVDKVPRESLQDWARRLLAVPLIRVIGKGTENRFNLAHAERASYAGAHLSDADIDTVNLHKIEKFHYVQGYDDFGTWYDQLLWGRSIRAAMAGKLRQKSPDLSITFTGHTITVAPRPGSIYELYQHVFLDTGAYLSVANPEKNAKAGLTLWDVHADKGYLLTPKSIINVSRESVSA